MAEVTVAAEDDDVDAFLAGIREPLEELGFAVRASGGGDESGPTARTDSSATRVHVVVDARPSDHVDILVWLSPSVRAAPVRRRVPRGTSTAVVVEEIAYAVRATVESLLAELTPPVPAPQHTTAQTSVTIPPTSHHGPRAAFGLDLAGFASVLGVASSTPVFGGGAALDFGFLGREPGRPNLYLAGSVYAPFDALSAEAALETMVYSLRAVPGVELARMGPLRIAVGVGVGGDIFHAQPRPTKALSVTLGSSTTLVDPVAEAQFLFRFGVHGASLFLALAVDYDLDPGRYVAIDRAGAPSNVLTEWALRPEAMLGLCLPVAGASACRETR
jgi:hypothetical protein